MKKLLPLVAVACLSLTACVVHVGGDKYDDDSESWEQIQRNNQQTLAKLTLGTSIAQVESLMGTPDFTEAFDSKGQAVQVLFYRTQHRHSDGQTTRDECTPLIFKAGNLVGWGDKPYKQL